MHISTPLRQLLKDHYFLATDEVDRICATAAYVVPMQDFLNLVASTFTVFELNLALKLVQDKFPEYGACQVVSADSDEIIFEFSREKPKKEYLTAYVKRGKMTVYETVSHAATSDGKARLEKRT